MSNNLLTTEIESRFNEVVEKYGNFLRNTIAHLCPKDLDMSFFSNV
ncbi:MAG: hypothetical protein AB1489_36270 [Acidobacteriota bacterium]